MRSRLYCLLWLLLASALKAAAQTPQPALPAPRFEHSVEPGPRHWRGTIGQQAVTMELDSGFSGYYGHYYYDRRGRPLSLSQEPAKQKGKARLDESFFDESGLSVVSGYFLFDSPLRTRLTGTWHSPDGRRTLPVALHETYADALAYGTETWEVKNFGRDDSYDSTRLDSAELRQNYLSFRPPLAAATRPLRAALGPPAAPPRLNHYLDSLLRTRHTGQSDYFFHSDAYVVYNSNQLFSVVQFEHFSAAEDDDSGMYTHEWSQRRTYDLRTGRRLRLADLLLPGYEQPLRRWLRQCLKSVWENQYYGEVGANGKLPAGGFSVTGTGLAFSYDDRDDDSLGFPGPYHADRSVEVEISYETLLPIIRLNGPLAALLRERHLLPIK
ncbi:MAG: hypothetical protein JWP58_3977 [Hymenobacter sp.]|nr:hypothetical protein [Hymenobacter sp.]